MVGLTCDKVRLGHVPSADVNDNGWHMYPRPDCRTRSLAYDTRKSPMAQWDTLFPDDQQPAGAGLAAATSTAACRRGSASTPRTSSNGLVQLVLTLIELLRELLERQALRRIDGGSLTAEEIERLGLTFLRLAEEMDRLKQQFGLSDDDLNLDLGPLGTLR